MSSIVTIIPLIIVSIICFMVIKRIIARNSCKVENEKDDVQNEKDDVQNENENKKKNIIKIAIIVFCCMGIVSFLDQFSENKVVITPVYEKLGITSMEYDDYKKIFAECDLGNVIDISAEEFFQDSNNEKLPNIFCLIIEGEKKPFEKDSNLFVVERDNKQITKILVNSYVVYQDGKVINSAKKFLNLTFQEKFNLEIEAKDYIRSNLVSPSSAKFSEFNWGRIDASKFVASAFVESKNVFGVDLITRFKVYFNRDENSFRIEYQ